MAQEFTIKSQAIEDKVNQLLPSQGGYQAGIDFSASTMVVPIVDLTETAEGSSLRQDLQTSLSLTTVTTNTFSNNTVTIINTTGYFRVTGNVYANNAGTATMSITDGTTTKQIFRHYGTASQGDNLNFDFNVFLEAGDSLTAFSSNSNQFFDIVTRQIADISGNLTNP